MKQKTFDLISNKSALFSPCGQYRYTLYRRWDQDQPMLAYIGENPSYATAERLDKTTTMCQTIARAHRYGGFWMLNLFAFISTNPDKLSRDENDIGPENDSWIKNIVAASDAVCICWGARSNAFFKQRANTVLPWIKEPLCLGTTKNGSPRHPSRLSNKQPLLPFKSQS